MLRLSENGGTGTGIPLRLSNAGRKSALRTSTIRTNFLAKKRRLPNQQSRLLSAPITVLGDRIKQLGATGEFAKVPLTVHPSESFEVIDRVAERSELEKLGVEWP